MMSNLQRDTLCVQAGYTPKTGESRIPQICQSTTFFYGDTQQMADLFDLKAEGFFYTRLANPTVEALEKRVAALEGGRIRHRLRFGHVCDLTDRDDALPRGRQYRLCERSVRRHLQPLRHDAPQARRRVQDVRRRRPQRKDRLPRRRQDEIYLRGDGRKPRRCRARL